MSATHARGCALLAAIAASACQARAPSTPAPPVVSQRGASCAGASLLPAPADLAATGPWSVGVRTVRVGELVVEVWYPAEPGSERGKERDRFDLRTAMPPQEASKIPDADNAWLPCACYREVPVDQRHGPYPVVVFFHGAASFRAQSAFLATHWASRGFVVIAPDLPGVGLAAMLGDRSEATPYDVPRRIVELALAAPPDRDPLAFIRPRLDRRLALVGHSLGTVFAGMVAERPELVARISMAGIANLDGGHASTLALAGEHDGIASADNVRAAFAGAASPARLVIVRGAGHLAFTDLCTIAADRGGALEVARTHGVAIPVMLASLASDGCRATDAPFAKTAPAIRAATTGVLEETLRCDPAATAGLAALASHDEVELVERLGAGPR